MMSNSGSMGRGKSFKQKDIVVPSLEEIKLFILDDRQENLDTAVKTLEDVTSEIQTATCYNQGKEVLNNFHPDFAIIDLNFPYQHNEKPEKLGVEFRREELEPRVIPSSIITGGIPDHGYFSVDIYFSLQIWAPGIETIPVYDHQRLTIRKTDKSNSKVWKIAYNQIKEVSFYIRSRMVHKLVHGIPPKLISEPIKFDYQFDHESVGVS